MAEAFVQSFQSLDNSLRRGLSNSLDATKTVTLATGRKLKNYCSFTQERMRDQVRDFRNFRTRRHEGCLGALLNLRGGRNRNSVDDEGDFYEPREDSSLLSNSQRRLSHVDPRNGEDEEIHEKEIILKRALKLASRKVAKHLRQAGSWLVEGLQGYTDAVYPHGNAINHTNTLYMYPYNMA